MNNFTKMLMKKATNIEDAPFYIKMLIYGDSGIGKTVFAASAPDLFIISDENGLLSLRNPDLKHIVNQTARQFPLDSFAEMNDIYEFLYNHCVLRDRLNKLLKNYEGKSKKEVPKEAIEKLNKIKDYIWSLENGSNPRNNQEPKLYYSVAIDSVTELAKRSMDRILDIKHGTGMSDSGNILDDDDDATTPEESEQPVPLNATDDDFAVMEGFANFESHKATLPDYGVNTNQMRKVVRAFRDLPMNVIFTALEKEAKDDLSGEIYTKPALTDKLAEDVHGYVDIVGYYYTMMVKEEGKPDRIDRIMQVQPFNNKQAKDRSGRLGIGVRNPTFTRIMNLIIGKE